MPMHDTDTSEMVLYDYSLQVGDTFRTPFSNHYVSDIDSVMINSNWYKVWSLVQCAPFTYIFGNYDVIEGIGCTFGIDYGITPLTFSETGTYLRCFANDGTNPALSTKVSGFFNNTTSCSSTFGVGVGVHNVESNSTTATLFPNPIDESSKIVLPQTIQSGTLVILNGIGQTIVNTSFQNKDELVIGNVVNTAGIYYYRITDNQSGSVFSGKFMYR